MKTIRVLALAFLGITLSSALIPGVWTKSSYDTQHRRDPNQPPGSAYPLGTDDLGRDRFARLLYGSRTSLLLAPAASTLAVGIGALAGVLSASFAFLRRPILYLVDVMLSTPLFFLLLITRALLPLDVGAPISVSITFLLLGLLGSAPVVRVFSASTQQIVDSDFILQARANGSSYLRILMKHFIPNLAPVLWTQFCVLLPIFVLAEANLSILGLGVAEPLPSLGNLMTELLNYPLVLEQPWLLVPAGLLAGITGSLRLLTVKLT